MIISLLDFEITIHRIGVIIGFLKAAYTRTKSRGTKNEKNKEKDKEKDKGVRKRGRINEK